MMAGTTTHYSIPYPTGADRLCDSWSYIQAIAENVDATLDILDTDINRFSIIPFARISISAAVTQDPVDGSLAFDTTDIDTTGMVDLSLDPTAIKVGVDALWLVGAYIKHSTSGTAGNLLSATILDDGSFATQYDQRDNGVGWEGKLSPVDLDAGLDESRYSVQLSQSGTAPTVPSADIARLFVVWMSDLP